MKTNVFPAFPLIMAVEPGWDGKQIAIPELSIIGTSGILERSSASLFLHDVTHPVLAVDPSSDRQVAFSQKIWQILP